MASDMEVIKSILKCSDLRWVKSEGNGTHGVKDVIMLLAGI